MKISLVGNCQAVPLTRCLTLMAPDHEIVGLHLDVSPIEHIAGSDVLLAQTVHRGRIAEAAAAWCPDARVLAWPTFNFRGFHPDLTVVRQGDGHAQTPLGDYNSAIAFAAWQQGLSPDEAEALFCEPVFRALGFFNYWEASRRALLADHAASGLALDGALERWLRGGCFAHTVNHPKLAVMGDVAAAVLRALGIAPRTTRPEDLLHDPLRDGPIWPVYPEIGRALDLPGDHAFKPAGGPDAPVALLDLREFLDASFRAYDAAPPGSLSCERLVEQPHRYRDLRALRPAPARRRSPYAALPDHQFWRRAVAAPDCAEVDPVVRTRFTLTERDRIATAGSCFAQHIARTLVASGYNYHVAEPPPAGMAPARAAASGYGLFSARYGNIYTARQLVQLFDRAHGRFAPADDAWQREDGRWIDPFRPQVEPDGHGSRDAVRAERDRHLAAVRTLFATLDVFVFTVGLTEAWVAQHDGAVVPVAPGTVAAGVADDAYRFHNFTAAEVEADLRGFAERLRSVNPAARLILTVSPVPLVATFEPRHVLVSTTASKAALRVAVDAVARTDERVDYFPSFEIITGSFNRGRYFADDLREVRPEGVDHVMRLFRRHYLSPVEAEPDAAITVEIARTAAILCDEELLDRRPALRVGPGSPTCAA